MLRWLEMSYLFNDFPLFLLLLLCLPLVGLAGLWVYCWKNSIGVFWWTKTANVYVRVGAAILVK